MSNTDLVHQWFDNLWNQGDESTIDTIMAPEVIIHGLAPTTQIGRELFHAFYQMFRAGFPRVHVTVERVIECGEYATCLASVDLSTADGKGPYRITGSVTVRCRDGRFVEGWNYFDFLSLVQQMKIVPLDVMARALAPAEVARQ